MKKQYLKSKPVCKVTFELPAEAADKAKSVHLVGDFNNWNFNTNEMKKLKNGNFSHKLDLETGSEYQFRYLINSDNWENDWSADKYVYTEFGQCDNSVVVV